jgi:hypothetical protein
MLVTGCNQAPFLTEHGRQSGPFDVIRPSTTTKLSPRKKRGQQIIGAAAVSAICWSPFQT